MTHGLKSLAQELPKHGRYGDTMVAHINPQEAALLKSLGGSGTINPTTGLPEFWGGLGALNPFNPGSAAGKAVGNIPGVSQLQKAATDVFQPVEKAIVQPASNALVNVDKAVGKAIPGGWGTLGMVAGSMMGLPTYAMVGLGALNGSGVMHPGRGFNLQGAMIGGAMAYGMSELGEYARAADTGGGNVDLSGSTAPTSGGITPPPADAIESLNASQGWTGPNAPTGSIPADAINVANSAGQNINPATGLNYGSVAGDTLSGTVPTPPPSVASQFLSGNVGDAFSQIGTNISEGAQNAYNSLSNSASNAYNTITNPETYSNLADKGMAAIDRGVENIGKTSSGIGNLLTGPSGTSAAAAAASGVNPMLATGATAYGAMGMMSMDEQRKYLDEAKKANAISQAEYDKALGEMNRSADDARKAVRDNPFNANPSRDASMDPTLYGRGNEIDNLYSRMKEENRLYADGGTVNPPDDQTGMPNVSPIKNFQGGMLGNDGIMGYAVGGQVNMGGGYDPFANLPNLASPIGGRSPDDGSATSFAESHSMNPPSNSGFSMNHIAGMAAGGMPPRFLSGGGDGMSDSIPAKINGNQEARLADGEFVIPADVVSHLGNGSSKAGANQLYSMMDKVRTARTGRKSQGKQINPRKYLPA